MDTIKYFLHSQQKRFPASNRCFVEILLFLVALTIPLTLGTVAPFPVVMIVVVAFMLITAGLSLFIGWQSLALLPLSYLAFAFLIYIGIHVAVWRSTRQLRTSPNSAP